MRRARECYVDLGCGFSMRSFVSDGVKYLWSHHLCSPGVWMEFAENHGLELVPIGFVASIHSRIIDALPCSRPGIGTAKGIIVGRGRVVSILSGTIRPDGRIICRTLLWNGRRVLQRVDSVASRMSCVFIEKTQPEFKEKV